MNKLTIGLLLASLSASALAEEKFSVDLLIGNAKQESDIEEISLSGSDVSYGIRGAYAINENISVEVAYHNYGEGEDSYIDFADDTINYKVKTNAINLGIKATLPLESGLSLHGRFGISSWDIKLKQTDSAFPGMEFTADEDGNDPYIGIGVQYPLNSKFKIGAEYMLSQMDVEDTSTDLDVKNFSLSASINF